MNFWVAILAFSFLSCGSVQKRSFGQNEILEAAGKLTNSMAKTMPKLDSRLVAIEPFQNRTSEHLEMRLLQSEVSRLMREKGFRVVSTEDRERSLEEASLGQSGMTNEAISTGNWKGPRYLVKAVIFEQTSYSSDQSKVLFDINMRLIDLQTTEEVWRDSVKFTKKRVAQYSW